MQEEEEAAAQAQHSRHEAVMQKRTRQRTQEQKQKEAALTAVAEARQRLGLCAPTQLLLTTLHSTHTKLFVELEERRATTLHNINSTWRSYTRLKFMRRLNKL